MKAGMAIEAVSAEVLRQSEAKADYIVNTSHLEMESYGGGVTMRLLDDELGDAVEPLDVNQIAHRQISTHLKIPAPYYDRMIAEKPELLAQNVNAWFRHEPVHRMVRTLDGTARAFLSNRFRRIDHMEIMQAVLPILAEIPAIRFESCQITESKLVRPDRVLL